MHGQAERKRKVHIAVGGEEFGVEKMNESLSPGTANEVVL